MFGSRTVATAALVTTLLAIACASTDPSLSEQAPEVQGSPTTAATVVSTASPTPAPSVTGTPSSTTAEPTASPALGAPEVAAATTVQLIEIATGRMHTLFEATESRPIFAAFTPDGHAVVRDAGGDQLPDQRFNLDGTPLRESEPVSARCVPIDERRIAIDGRPFEASIGPVQCGLISPDRRWMLDERDVVTAPIGGVERTRSWDQWLINLGNGAATLLQEDLQHCGGCGGVFGPRWSPSGRYVYFADLVQNGRIFLADVDGADVRMLDTGGRSGLLQRPEWAPRSDRLLYPDPEGNTVYEDLNGGVRLILNEVPWPAAFDPTERYIYSPSYESLRTGEPPPRSTVIVALADPEVIETRPGHAPSGLLWGAPGTPLLATENGFVAALEDAPGCGGTTVYGVDGDELLCVPNGSGAVFAPDGTKLAISVRMERIEAVTGPGFSGDTAWRYEVFVVELAEGELQLLSTGALSYDAPAMHWNDRGTHLLVTWPTSYGL